MEIQYNTVYKAIEELITLYDGTNRIETDTIEIIKVLLAEKFDNHSKVYDLITLWLVGNEHGEYDYVSPHESDLVSDHIHSFTMYLINNYG